MDTKTKVTKACSKRRIYMRLAILYKQASAKSISKQYVYS
jgi:hypothetical protein